MKQSCAAGQERRRSVPTAPEGGRQGFTMIEMLTVIAIIAILAGILFPVFSTVRRNVWKAQCTTNLHSLAQGLKLYKDDHGIYPDALYGFYAAPAAGGASQEINFLYPQYIKEKQVFHCPLAPFHVDPAGHCTEGGVVPTQLTPFHVEPTGHWTVGGVVPAKLAPLHVEPAISGRGVGGDAY